MNDMIYHAWYSQKQRECAREFPTIRIYEFLYEYDFVSRQYKAKPHYIEVPKHTASVYLDAGGNEIVVTTVSKTMNHGCSWDDMVYLGTVVKYVKGLIY